MRTKERWEKIVRPRIFKTLTPRIVSDLNAVQFTAKLPKLIESSYLFGDTSTGKTLHALRMLLRESLNIYLDYTQFPYDYNNDLLFVNCIDLFERIKSNFDGDDRRANDNYINQLKNCHLLVLDDIGVKRSNEWSLEILYNIINYRYEYMKKTIYTANISLEQLAEQLGDDRIPSRIKRQCKIIKKEHYK